MFNIERGGDSMNYDYSKLKGRIKEVCGSQGVFACGIKLSERSVSLKLNNERDWKQSEIQNSCRVLKIEDNEISSYFFTPQVQN